MIIAATDWLSISINLLLVLFVLVCALLIPIILMQRPKQEGLGAAFGAGVTDQVFGAQTTNVLQKATVYLGTAFFVLSLTLAILIGHKNDKVSLLDQPKDSKPASENAKTTSSATGESKKSLSEQLPAENPKSGAPAPVETNPPAVPAEQSAPTPAPGGQ